MKITPLYNEKPAEGTCLVTGQVLSNPSTQINGFNEHTLEATLQFVQGSSAVEYDFSAYLLVQGDRSNLDQERQTLLEEIDAVNRLADHVRSFQEAYLKAATRILDKIDAASA